MRVAHLRHGSFGSHRSHRFCFVPGGSEHYSRCRRRWLNVGSREGLLRSGCLFSSISQGSFLRRRRVK
jgi:hypothetical protein